MTSLMITCVLFQNECEPSEWCLRNGVYGLDAVTPQFKLFCNVTTCLPNMADDCFNMVRAFHLKFSVTDCKRLRRFKPVEITEGKVHVDLSSILLLPIYLS